MINNVVLMGRLIADPELKNTNTGLEVCSFCIAVDRRFQKKDGEKQTDFINVTAWRQTAAFVCKYFRKGQMIALQGSIQTEKYEDKDGNKRTSFKVVADNVSFCGGKNESASSQVPSNDYRGIDAVEDDPIPDDVPF